MTEPRTTKRAACTPQSAVNRARVLSVYLMLARQNKLPPSTDQVFEGLVARGWKISRSSVAVHIRLATDEEWELARNDQPLVVHPAILERERRKGGPRTDKKPENPFPAVVSHPVAAVVEQLESEGVTHDDALAAVTAAVTTLAEKLRTNADALLKPEAVGGACQLLQQLTESLAALAQIRRADTIIRADAARVLNPMPRIIEAEVLSTPLRSDPVPVTQQLREGLLAGRYGRAQ